MPWTPNPDVPAFVPRSVAPNPPVNGQKPITILSKQNDKSATNKTTKKSMEEKNPETNSSDGKFAIQQVDFPSMVSEPQPQENLIWSRAGFRSFKDVAASGPLSKPCSSKTIEPMEVSSEKQDETEKKKKKPKKKPEDVNAKPVKTKPKPQGMTLDQIVVAKFIQEVSKTTVSTRPKKVDKVKPAAKKSRNRETPRNQLDSTAPRMRKGKTREVPKKKKPTTLKKFIIMEKELRKRNLAASKEFKRKNLELVVDAAIKSVDFSDLTSMEERFEENSSDHGCEVEREEEDMNDVMTSMESLSLEQKVTQLIHCNYYRDYCNQCVTDEIDHLATNLLVDIVRFQDRMHAKDPQKASIKRRYCCGLREVEKYLTIKKVKCLLVAPDIQKIMANGVLDQTVHKLIEKSRETETPIVFLSNKKTIGLFV